MILFYAYTQYNLFNCINIRLNYHSSDYADICFVRPDDTNMNRYYDKLIGNGVFGSIYEFDSKWINDNNIITKIISAPSVCKSIRRNYKKISNITFKEKVDILYTYGSSVEMYLLYDHIKRTNNKYVSLICYEEGIGSYYRLADNQLGRLTTNIVESNLHIKIPSRFDSLLLYQPKCLGKDQPCEVLQMRAVDKKNINILNDVFQFRNKGDYSKFVFFDSVDRPVDRFLSNVVKDLNVDNFTIKKHPRSIANDDCYSFKYNNDQWEMICMNYSTNNKVLISEYSSAMFTPKSLFGEEPYLVFLFNMEETKKYEKQGVSQLFYNYLMRFKESYSDEKKIHIPRNINELIMIIDSLRKV